MSGTLAVCCRIDERGRATVGPERFASPAAAEGFVETDGGSMPREVRCRTTDAL